jgi:hypothetical protein
MGVNRNIYISFKEDIQTQSSKKYLYELRENCIQKRN